MTTYFEPKASEINAWEPWFSSLKTVPGIYLVGSPTFHHGGSTARYAAKQLLAAGRSVTKVDRASYLEDFPAGLPSLDTRLESSPQTVYLDELIGRWDWLAALELVARGFTVLTSVYSWNVEQARNRLIQIGASEAEICQAVRGVLVALLATRAKPINFVFQPDLVVKTYISECITFDSSEQCSKAWNPKIPVRADFTRKLQQGLVLESASIDDCGQSILPGEAAQELAEAQ